MSCLLQASSALPPRKDSSPLLNRRLVDLPTEPVRTLREQRHFQSRAGNRIVILIEDMPCFNSKGKTKCFKITGKTQQCINIIFLLWLHVSVQRYEVQSVHIMYFGIPYYLQGAHENSLKL